MTNVYIFDFDDTIFRSPRPADAPHSSSWWRDPASLEYPYVREDTAWSMVIPGTYDRMITAAQDPRGVIIVLTARTPELAEQVNQVLDWVSAPRHIVFAVGTPGLENKLEVIYEVLRSSRANSGNDVQYVEMWDDRADHLIAFRDAIKHWSPETAVTTRHVT
jgi:hypothetical protein